LPRIALGQGEQARGGCNESLAPRDPRPSGDRRLCQWPALAPSLHFRRRSAAKAGPDIKMLPLGEVLGEESSDLVVPDLVDRFAV